MRIAVVSDIHGNWTALETVLADARAHKIDEIICAGDLIDPMPSSRRVFDYLMKEKIVTLRGNHEDYVTWAFDDPNHKMNQSIAYRPVKVTASLFDTSAVEALRRLPYTHVVKNEGAGDLLLCHASPGSNTSGWRYGISQELEIELDKISENTIVCGHWHHAETRDWKNKRLVTVGSVGVPLSGRLAAEYAILEAVAGEWTIEHRAVPYDPTPTLEEYRVQNWLERSGPVGWILFFEVVSARRTLLPFFEWQRNQNLDPQTEAEWRSSAEAYLRSIGGWSSVEKYSK